MQYADDAYTSTTTHRSSKDTACYAVTFSGDFIGYHQSWREGRWNVKSPPHPIIHLWINPKYYLQMQSLNQDWKPSSRQWQQQRRRFSHACQKEVFQRCIHRQGAPACFIQGLLRDTEMKIISWVFRGTDQAWQSKSIKNFWWLYQREHLVRFEWHRAILNVAKEGEGAHHVLTLLFEILQCSLRPHLKELCDIWTTLACSYSCQVEHSFLIKILKTSFLWVTRLNCVFHYCRAQGC